VDLPWKRHFGIVCSCQKGSVVEVTREQASMKDPTDILTSLPIEDQQDMAMFYAEHLAMGHELRPDFVDIAPLPKS